MAVCEDCGAGAPEPRQASFQAVPIPVRCARCERKAQIRHYFVALPEEEGDAGWSKLTEWEQGFLESVRESFAERGTLSDKQLEVLERIYKKLA